VFVQPALQLPQVRPTHLRPCRGKPLRGLANPPTSLQGLWALLLVLWDESPDNEKRERKNISKRQKNIEHGGDNSYHAQCYVFEVLENYQKDARQSSPDLESSLR
jgi:hypothetical protein